MIIPLEFVLLINILVIVYILYCTFSGFKKGLIIQCVSLCGLVLGIFASIVFAPILAENITIIPLAEDATVIQGVIANFVHLGIWYVLIIIVVRIIINLLGRFLNKIFKLPLLNTANKIGGAIIGLVSSLFTIFIFTIILSMPIFNNGKEIIEKTVLSSISSFTYSAEEYIESKVLENEEFQGFIKEAMKTPEKLEELQELFSKVDLDFLN